MYKLEKRLRSESDANLFERIRERERLALEEHRIKCLQESLAKATYNGTTPKYLVKRNNLVSNSTFLNTHYHQNMTYYRSLLLEDNRASNIDSSKIREKMNEFARKFPLDNSITYNGARISRSRRYTKDYTQGYYAHPNDHFLTYDIPYTSDDTKSKEARPLKRNAIASNISSFHSDTVPKRFRQDSNSDSTVAGSVKVADDI
ncbi:unnamed protein product [Rhizophagus irregularis]|uniref:Uncharacterized protein n=1 Tax=Rhizophagus irregularis TaxID=588596 RepID=A0A2I1HFU3_9GLOM|nr:hypothetical protein RhiirA4_479056 [Rhizophagus irregularis]CAB4435086.1 unnamed protein product [Rhizophagus irregularis]